jgi:16S rRNA (cytosine1402-N4)-methyltransferase
LIEEVFSVLRIQPGDLVVDCTAGWGGHAVEMLRRVGPEGRLIAVDTDLENLPRARERLEAIGCPFVLCHANFAALPSILASAGVTAIDCLLADLGMSSMQVDDVERGFSYMRDGPLDMRMDRSRGRTAAQILTTISEKDLARALAELGDEPDAENISRAIVSSRERRPLLRTGDLAGLILESTRTEKEQPWRLHPSPDRWDSHPAARTFQALRLLVNRELANLDELLRVLPTLLKPGGRAAIISFHSGEDRRVKAAFREGLHAGSYARISDDPIRATLAERIGNPRSRSAKLRFAVTREAQEVLVSTTSWPLPPV